MYLEYYGLKAFPFANTADPRFFFAGESHEEALAAMAYVIEHGKGMVVVTGDAGSGKTLAANVLSLRLRRDTLFVNITDPLVSADQFMQCVHAGLMGRPQGQIDRLAVSGGMTDRLIALHRMGQRVAVVVDEAQDLSDEVWQQIRLMSNWEHKAQKLIQWVIVGQPELRDMLGEARWEPLRQRVALCCHLERLDTQQVAAYIQHRLTVAGGGTPPRVRFDAAAIAAVAQASGRAPRMINHICDAALLAAYADGQNVITGEMVGSSAREMTSCGWRNNPDCAEKTYKMTVAAAG